LEAVKEYDLERVRGVVIRKGHEEVGDR